MIYFLIVTYKECFRDSTAFKSLINLNVSTKQNLKVFSFHNSSNQNLPAINRQIEGIDTYEISSQLNLGLAGGYNALLELIDKLQPKGVIFLNADCVVTEMYFQQVFKNMSTSKIIVPRLISKKKQISPFNKRGFDYIFYIIGFMCVNFSVIKKVRFPEKFWLDGIDYWFSKIIAQKNIDVKVLNLNIDHNLSMSDNYNFLSLKRYKNILQSEYTFINNEIVAPIKKTLLLFEVFGRALIKSILRRRFDFSIAIFFFIIEKTFKKNKK